tara:strand:- start:4260 stop:5300 length:1041 start_codon:yes stop_codon:yes gene_type:complete
MAKFRECVSFDDVLLVPQKSDIESRSEVKLNSEIGKQTFRLPVISSPMDTVTEEEMAISITSAGGMGIVHRYNTPVEQASIVANIRDHFESENSISANHVAAAVGATRDLHHRASTLFEAGARIFCIDVAHGHHVLMEKAIKLLKDKFSNNILVIAGNVATAEAYVELSEWGADAVRIGIGGGSICSTRLQTGHGVPTLQSVFDCAQEPGAAIIADGGIKKAGDIVKALAAGADFAMLGSMLAGTTESPGETIVTKEGQTRKVYRGMASVEAQTAWRGQARSLEGISTTVPFKGPVETVLNNLERNIKSGLSYSGARCLRELRGRARFIKQTAASQVESSTHILVR